MAIYAYNKETKKVELLASETSYKDPNSGLNGPVYCPEQGYYDMVLDRRFETKNQKREYMRANGLKMQSGSRPTIKPLSKYYFIPGLKNNRYYKHR